jgi:pyrimidine deaminase RibD-like protein
MKIKEILENIDSNRADYEIHNYKKLDRIMSKLCDLVDQGQSSDKNFGMVAAAVLDPENQIVARLNRPGKDGKRLHAEHAAIMDYNSKHGSIPEGSIILTTLSPCNEHMDERDGPSCTDIVNESRVKKVYCGYMDPTQDNDTRKFTVMETSNKELRNRCKAFADTFLGDVKEGINFGSVGSVPQHNIVANKETHKKVEPISASAKTHNKPNPAVKLDISHGAGKEVQQDSEYRRQTRDNKQILSKRKQNYDRVKAGYDWQSDDEEQDYVGENFADGRHPEDKGDSSRHGIPKHASLSGLDKIGRGSGRKAQLARWQANMRRGRAK